MSKYIDELIKGNKTLSAKVNDLESEIKALQEDEAKMSTKLHKLQEENSKLKICYCKNKGNCSSFADMFVNSLDMIER